MPFHDAPEGMSLVVAPVPSATFSAPTWNVVPLAAWPLTKPLTANASGEGTGLLRSTKLAAMVPSEATVPCTSAKLPTAGAPLDSTVDASRFTVWPITTIWLPLTDSTQPLAALPTRISLACAPEIEPFTRAIMPTRRSDSGCGLSSILIVAVFDLNSTPLTHTLPNAVIVPIETSLPGGVPPVPPMPPSPPPPQAASASTRAL